MQVENLARRSRISVLQFFIIAVAFISSASLSPTLRANAQTKVPLTHETMWMMKRVGAPVPSPDGCECEAAAVDV